MKKILALKKHTEKDYIKVKYYCLADKTTQEKIDTDTAEKLVNIRSVLTETKLLGESSYYKIKNSIVAHLRELKDQIKSSKNKKEKYKLHIDAQNFLLSTNKILLFYNIDIEDVLISCAKESLSEKAYTTQQFLDDFLISNPAINYHEQNQILDSKDQLWNIIGKEKNSNGYTTKYKIQKKDIIKTIEKNNKSYKKLGRFYDKKNQAIPNKKTLGKGTFKICKNLQNNDNCILKTNLTEIDKFENLLSLIKESQYLSSLSKKQKKIFAYNSESRNLALIVSKGYPLEQNILEKLISSSQNHNENLKNIRNFFLALINEIETLHSIGIVHNDIKINQFIFKKSDSNTLFTYDENHGYLKVIDFGLSFKLTSENEQSNYLSINQLGGTFAPPYLKNRLLDHRQAIPLKMLSDTIKKHLDTWGLIMSILICFNVKVIENKKCLSPKIIIKNIMESKNLKIFFSESLLTTFCESLNFHYDEQDNIKLELRNRKFTFQDDIADSKTLNFLSRLFSSTL